MREHRGRNPVVTYPAQHLGFQEEPFRNYISFEAQNNNFPPDKIPRRNYDSAKPASRVIIVPLTSGLVRRSARCWFWDSPLLLARSGSS